MQLGTGRRVFTAKEPDEIGEEKCDETAGSMVTLLKYGSGFPFKRIEELQNSLGIPLPASTQWNIIENAANRIHPAYNELIRQGVQEDPVTPKPFFGS